MCKVFIITKYDNNVIIIFDNSKYIYYLFFLLQYDNNNIITISFLDYILIIKIDNSFIIFPC